MLKGEIWNGICGRLSCQMVIQCGWKNGHRNEPYVTEARTLYPLQDRLVGLACHFPGSAKRVWAAKSHDPVDRLDMAAVV
jgi:hypothetical protein